MKEEFDGERIITKITIEELGKLLQEKKLNGYKVKIIIENEM